MVFLLIYNLLQPYGSRFRIPPQTLILNSNSFAMKTLQLFLATLSCFSYVAGNGSSQILSTGQQVNWHTFQWHPEENGYMVNTSHHVMVVDLRIEALPETYSFMLNMNSPHSFLYEHTYEAITYRSPLLRNKVQTIPRPGNVFERLITGLSVGLNGQFVGEDNMRIIPDNGSGQRIRGLLGFGVFYQNEKVLLIDQPGSRLAWIDELPEQWEEKASLVPMIVEMGQIMIPVSVNGRTENMLFDGTTRPAMIAYHNRTFNQVSSSQKARDKLIRNNGSIDEPLEGYVPKEELFFEGNPLTAHDVYLLRQRTPSRIRASISQVFFEDYILIFDYKNQRFGILNPSDL